MKIYFYFSQRFIINMLGLLNAMTTSYHLNALNDVRYPHHTTLHSSLYVYETGT